MTNIFIDILILLEHRSQVVKDIFLRYHLTIESNISLLLCGTTEITLHVVLNLLSLNFFCLQSSSSQLQLLVNPHHTLIHQNYIICKEYTP
jgi:hypothetical protein